MSRRRGFGWVTNGTDELEVFEWVVSGPGTYEIEVKHERAGTVKTSVTI